LVLGNLIKSLIVFTLTAAEHDWCCFILLQHTAPPGKPVRLTDAIVTAPFFMIQPFGLAIEAIVKARWRGRKSRYRNSLEERKPESALLVYVEKLVGFVWTWSWLFWTAGWFLDAIVHIGLFRRGEGQPVFASLFGGVIWGIWRH